MNRRDFLANAFRVGGFAALYSLGLSPKEIAAITVSGRPAPGGVAAANGYTLTSIDLCLSANTGQQTLTAYIYSDSSDNPGTALGTSTNTIAYGSVVTYFGNVFTFDGVELTNGTKYWIVVKAIPINGSNFIRWISDSNGSGLVRYSGASISWTAIYSYPGAYKTYSGSSVLQDSHADYVSDNIHLGEDGPDRTYNATQFVAGSGAQ